jgi:hypothetical protein
MLPVQISQQRHEYSCGPTCAHAVINYLLKVSGIPHEKSLKKVERELPSWPTGILLATIGIWALKKGCQASVWVSKESSKMWKSDEWPRWSKRMTQFKNHGGGIHRGTITQFLHWSFKQNRPVIAEIDDGVMHGANGEGHYVVVTGVTKGIVSFQDPYYSHHRSNRLFSVPVKKFLDAVKEVDGSLLSLNATKALWMSYMRNAL